MEYKVVQAGPFEVNTYVVYNTANTGPEGLKPGFIIDPGGRESKIDEIIKKENIKLEFILNTHCHIDHVLKDNYFKNKYGIKIMANQAESVILENLREQADYLGFDFNDEIKIDKFLKDGEVISLGDIKIKTIYTPGHSPGGVSFLVNDKFLFSGDTLFKNTIGRTDLLGGSMDDIIKSIKNKLLVLGDDVKVLPGHGEPSLISEEKKYNPYIL